jgi:hypothetical protein
MKYPGAVSTNGSTPHITTADEWRQRKEEKMRGKAVPLTLPSGLVIKLARPPIQTWFGTAKLPETLSKNVINIFGTTTEEADPDKAEQIMNEKVKMMSEKDQIDLVNFMNRLLLESVIEPQLVDKDPRQCTKNEFALSDLDEEERAYILFAIMAGVPDQPVPVANGGEVSVEQLGKFRGTKRSPRARKARGKVPRTSK